MKLDINQRHIEPKKSTFRSRFLIPFCSKRRVEARGRRPGAHAPMKARIMQTRLDLTNGILEGLRTLVP